MKIVFTTLLLCCFSTIWAQNAIVKSEFIYQPNEVSFPSCHASTIAETPDGLVAAWFGGTAERDKDVEIWISKLTSGNWSKPVSVANGIQHKDLRYPTWNPVLFYHENKLYLFFKVGPSPADWWGEYIISKDNGVSWSRQIRLPEEILGPIKNKPVLLKNGELICPSSSEKNGWTVHMEITPDFGKTWEKTEPLNHTKKQEAIQPTVLIHPGGKLQQLCRSKNQFILTSWSTDNGRNWSEMKPTSLPNPNSGIDAVSLKNGQFLLVYNHIKPTEKWGSRNLLNLAISDDGIHWEAALMLENDPNIDGEYSYPAIIQTSDGLVHIVYTWNRKLIRHVVVDPLKIKAQALDGTNWPAEK